MLATVANENSAVWHPTDEAFAYVTDRNGTDEIWIHMHGTDRPVVTERDFYSGRTFYLDAPAFSPDGQRIAFTRRVRGGTTSIWISPVAGGPAVRLAPIKTSHKSPSWSPDGDWITFVSVSGGKTSLLKARVGGSGGSQVLKDNLFYDYPQWSPDGRWITYGTSVRLHICDLRSAMVAECGCGGAESAQGVGSCALLAVKLAGK